MPWDRKRLLGYVETIQLILGVTDKSWYRNKSSKILCWCHSLNLIYNKTGKFNADSTHVGENFYEVYFSN